MDLLNYLMIILNVILNILTLIGTLFSVYQVIIHFLPEKEYFVRYKMTKVLKKFLNRNLSISTKFFKSCTLTENISKTTLFEEIKLLFSKKNNMIVVNDDDGIRVHFNEKAFSFDYMITFEEYDDIDGHHNYILIKQESEVCFKDMYAFLNQSIWILRDILDLDSINKDSDNVDIVISSHKFNFFNNTLKILGDINGENWNIHKNKNDIEISMNFPYTYETILKINELILLNISNS